MRDVQKAEELLELVEARLDEYRSSLAEGRTIDLKGFEERIHTLCEMVTTLPKEHAKQFEGRMKDLTQRLTEVSSTLTEQYEAVRRELKGVDASQKARDAYVKTSTMPGLPPKPKDNNE